MEHRRLELLTPTLPVLCATNCANAPRTSDSIAQVLGFVNPLFSIFCKKFSMAGMKNILKKSKLGVDFWHDIAYNNFRTKRIGELCNGSTYDSDSYCLGSNPSSPANGSMVKRLRRRPLKAKSGVRFPLGLPVNAHRIAMSVFYILFCFPSSNR